MKKVVTSQELTESAKRVAQMKRLKTIQERKNFVIARFATIALYK